MEGRGKESSELEALASLVVLLSTRVERLFELCEGNHRRSDELELVIRGTRSDLKHLANTVFNSK